MKIDLLTAKPALELMLASNGFESPFYDPRTIWEIFLKYLAVPAEAEIDLASFQTSFLEPDEETESTAVFIFARQLTVDGDTRSVQLQFSASPSSAEIVDVWSDDFADVAEFAGYVESLLQFEIMCRDANQGELYVEHME